MKRFFTTIFFLTILVSSSNFTYGQSVNPLSDREQAWVDSIISTLTLDQMFGQLIVIRANNPNEAYFSVIDGYITKYGIGGVTFFGGKPYRQAVQTNKWQSISNIPLLISIDAEWGLGMRLDSTVSFPYQMTLGAIPDDSVSSALIHEMGKQIGKQCQRLGIQMNFAPVVDINCNPANPVIHMRSFGEDRHLVYRKGLAYMQGMQEEGILATAKHFPGHGDTDMDSHLTLPLIRYDTARLDSVELYPYYNLINNGLSGVMVAHLYIPSLEPTSNVPSTLSEPIITGLLKEKMDFDGLIVTDALDMKGVTKYFAPGEIEVRALLAGDDILLLSADVPAAVSGIRKAISDGRLTSTLIQEKCEKVLHYKYRAGLSQKPVIPLVGLHEDLTPVESDVLIGEMFEQAVTLVKNEDNLLPLQRLDTLSIASVSIGHGMETPFQQRLNYYARVPGFFTSREPSPEETARILKSLEPFDLVIISIQNTSIWNINNFSISETAISFVRQIQENKMIILDLFTSPYSLKLFQDLPNAKAVIMSYQDHPVMQDVSAQAIFGGIAFLGRLPVTAAEGYPLGAGYDTEACRLKYTMPEALGIPTSSLTPIDSIVEDCIKKRIFPGCQVYASKDGQVFFLKSYGKPTYESKRSIGDLDIYDLASLTKVVASTPTVMQLYEQGSIDLDQTLGHYLPELKGTNKSSIVIRPMMAHQARLKPWIPFYTFTMHGDTLDPEIYKSAPSEEYPTRVAENLYIRRGYDQVIMDTIISSNLLRTNDYKYSDLGYYFLRKIIEGLTHTSLDDYSGDYFYNPLGMNNTGYLPRKTFPLEKIVPTENDQEFRHQLLQGDVHDQGAAMLGGVAGHAGVFSNANDLGKFMQMLMNGGTYGGVSYLQQATITEFTRQQFPLNDNRRGIGFDKPLPDYSSNGPVCEGASRSSYGHSGFTGTYLWADPENGLVYVFLSNRVYPSSKNNKLSDMGIRSKIHQCFYDAIEKNKTFAPQK
jgi:beta-glucosidase-like glycosyl hydrolase/CubicO group peptidase (beta-lactamase class C family)